MGLTRSFGDVGPMSGLPEDEHGRHALICRPRRWPALIAGASRRRKARMPYGCQPSPCNGGTGAPGLPIEYRVRAHALGDCDVIPV
jgi:hypothetical protein